MAKVHMILQGKGGVGKSLIAVMLAQYKSSRGAAPLCIDTDPINATFESFKALRVRSLRILEGDEIDPRSFDGLVEWVVGSSRDVIVDNGSSAFIPLTHYLVSNHVPALLQQLGHELVVHTIITGGQALADTINGFTQLLRQFSLDARFVVWLNPYWGPVIRDGKSFDQWPCYSIAPHRVSAIVALPTLKAETYGLDFREMLRARLTFEEALATDGAPIMTRQRLRLVRDQLFSTLDLAGLVS